MDEFTRKRIYTTPDCKAIKPADLLRTIADDIDKDPSQFADAVVVVLRDKTTLADSGRVFVWAGRAGLNLDEEVALLDVAHAKAMQRMLGS